MLSLSLIFLGVFLLQIEGKINFDVDGGKTENNRGLGFGHVDPLYDSAWNLHETEKYPHGLWNFLFLSFFVVVSKQTISSLFFVSFFFLSLSLLNIFLKVT